MANNYFQVSVNSNTVSSNLSSLGVAVPFWATQMLVIIETSGGAVRYRTDDQPATSNIGFPISNYGGAPWPIEGRSLANTQFISTGANVNVSLEFRRSLNI